MRDINILLVEDDDIDAEAVQRAFEQKNIRNPLHLARDGIEALEMLRGEANGEVPEPRLLLVDLNMPRMDGIEFLQNLRDDAQLRHNIAFVLTTSRHEQDMVNAYNLNVAGYLVKPNRVDEFHSIIDMLERYWQTVEFPTEQMHA